MDFERRYTGEVSCKRTIGLQWQTPEAGRATTSYLQLFSAPYVKEYRHSVDKTSLRKLVPAAACERMTRIGVGVIIVWI